MSTQRFTLFATRGTGSAIAEAVIALAARSASDDRPGIELELVDVEYPKDGPRNERLFELNPLGQLPTLVLAAGAVLAGGPVRADGTVMTESAAIVLLLDEMFPEAGLAPAVGSPERAAFLRHLIFLVTSIYPTFTYGDFPARWVPAEASQRLVESTDRHRERMWRWLEQQARAPWFLGERFSALDLYVAVMTHWRPRRRWFAEECPRLLEIARRCDALPELAAVWQRNFPAR